MFMQRIYDLECNRCKGTYKSTDRDETTLYVGGRGLSVCSKCTQDIAALMGYDKEGLANALASIKQAETENNKIKRKEEGVVCAKCEKKFGWSEPRVRESSASNVESWHIGCYGSGIEIVEAPGDLCGNTGVLPDGCKCPGCRACG